MIRLHSRILLMFVEESWEDNSKLSFFHIFTVLNLLSRKENVSQL